MVFQVCQSVIPLNCRALILRAAGYEVNEGVPSWEEDTGMSGSDKPGVKKRTGNSWGRGTRAPENKCEYLLEMQSILISIKVRLLDTERTPKHGIIAYLSQPGHKLFTGV